MTLCATFPHVPQDEYAMLPLGDCTWQAPTISPAKITEFKPGKWQQRRHLQGELDQWGHHRGFLWQRTGLSFGDRILMKRKSSPLHPNLWLKMNFITTWSMGVWSSINRVKEIKLYIFYTMVYLFHIYIFHD